MSMFDVNLHSVIYSLSDALDLVGVTHIHHGKRVAFMATEVAKLLGWGQQDLDRLFQSAILHDCGVSKTYIHSRLTQLAWEEEQAHCDVGATLLESSALLAPMAPIIRYHHTHWETLQPLDLPEIVKLCANLIYMVDRVDVLTLTSMKDNSNVLLGRGDTLKTLADHAGSWFHEPLVSAFMEVSASEAFWFNLESDHVRGHAASWIGRDTMHQVAFEDLRSLVRIFSVIVDAKSTFTREHSDGVARLSRRLGELMGFGERDCEMLEIAGLLHDLGKLRVPDDLLEAPRPLQADEYAAIKRHSFDTFNILKCIDGFQEIALWASQHHERIDGSGYPYHMASTRISKQARIIAVADIYQALAQNRPYRGPMMPADILEILRKQSAVGALDGEIIDCVEAHLAECHQIAC